MEQVIIGVDPHKMSVTIEVVDGQEKLLGSGRFTTDQAGYSAMRIYAKTWPERVWAVEGVDGAGRPLTLLAELLPGRAKKAITALQAKPMLAGGASTRHRSQDPPSQPIRVLDRHRTPGCVLG